MKKNSFDYENITENFSMEELSAKIRSEITAMNYSVTENKTGEGFELFLEKDTAPMELFLGRWQKLRVTLTERNGTVKLLFDKKNMADKIVCYIIGVFFFFIPYIFCFVATGNRNEIQRVIEKIVNDYITKRRSEFNERNGTD